MTFELSEHKYLFINSLLETQCLKFGDFALKSGEYSPFFIDFGCINSGQYLDFIGDFFAKKIFVHFPTTNVLFGSAYKGINLVTAISISAYKLFNKNLSIFYDRKEDKQHGEKGSFIGYNPCQNDRIIIIDDVISSGRTKLDAIEIITEKFKIKPIGIIVAIDRRTCYNKKYNAGVFDIPFYSIVNLEDICAFLKQQNNPKWQIIKDFYENTN